MENPDFTYDADKIAQRAFDLVKPAIDMLLKAEGSENLHIVVLSPRYKPWEVKFSDAIAKEFSFGDKSKWKYDYQKFARNKALQAFRNQQSNEIVQMLGPATLDYCDVIYSGSFFYYGVIVACSGTKQHFDTMISGWMAVAFQQIWQDQFKKAKATYPDKNFIQDLVFPD